MNKGFILYLYHNFIMDSQEIGTAPCISNEKSKRGVVAKSYAQRQKEYRKRKKIKNQLQTEKKLKKTNAQYQQEFRQRQKEKLQQNEALNLARKQKNAERAKRYRDKLKFKSKCAELDSAVSSKKDSLLTEIHEGHDECSTRKASSLSEYKTSTEEYKLIHNSSENYQENEDFIKQEIPEIEKHSQFNLAKLISKMANESESLLNSLSTERPKGYYSNSRRVKLEYEEGEPSHDYNIHYKIDEEKPVSVKNENVNIVEHCIDQHRTEEENNVKVKIENADIVEHCIDQYQTEEEDNVTVKIENVDIVEQFIDKSAIYEGNSFLLKCETTKMDEEKVFSS